MKTLGDVVATVERWLKDESDHRPTDGQTRDLGRTRRFVHWDRAAVEGTVLEPLRAHAQAAKGKALEAISEELRKDDGGRSAEAWRKLELPNAMSREAYTRQIAEEFQKRMSWDSATAQARAFVAELLGETTEEQRLQGGFRQAELRGMRYAAAALCEYCGGRKRVGGEGPSYFAMGNNDPELGPDGWWRHPVPDRHGMQDVKPEPCAAAKVWEGILDAETLDAKTELQRAQSQVHYAEEVLKRAREQWAPRPYLPR